MEMQLASERRTSRRAVNVVCQVVREEGFELVATRGVDLSPEGMLVSCDADVEAGEELLVSLRVPGTSRWVDAIATVARVVRGHRKGDRGRALGLSFSLDSDAGRLVRWSLRRFPPPFPSRALRVDYAATAAMIALS